MQKLNYLSILLILLAFFVFYNEFNKELNMAEMALLAIAFIAIVRTSYNYIEIDNSNKLYESFVSQKQKKYNRNKSADDDDDDTFIIKSEESDVYLDIEDEMKNDMKRKQKNSMENTISLPNKSTIDDEAKKTIDSLLGISKDYFDNILDPNITQELITPFTTAPYTNSSFVDTDTDTDTNKVKDDIKSVFIPKIVIGRNSSNDDTNYENNLSGGSGGGSGSGGSGSGGGSGGSGSRGSGGSSSGRGNSNYRGGNGGFGNNSMPERWNTPYAGREFDVIDNQDTTMNEKLYTEKKKCGSYNSRGGDERDDGNFVVKEYKDAKTFHPGYTYLPPSNWDVPQQYPPVCLSKPNIFKLTGLMDKGLPINALELNPQGKIANTEDTVQLTNVGSMLPKFNFEEQPFSKPYV